MSRTSAQLDRPVTRSRAAVQSLPQALTLLGGDVFAALICFGAVNWMQDELNKTPLDLTYSLTWLLIWVMLRAYQGFYPGYGRSPQNELRLHVISTLQMAVVQFAATFAVHDFSSSRLALGLMWLGLLFVALPLRYGVRALLIRAGRFGRAVSIIGAGKTGELTVAYLQQHPDYGLRPVAVYDDDPSRQGQSLLGVPILGPLEQAVLEPLTSHAIISIPGARAERQSQIINSVHSAYPITWATPDFFGVPNQALVPHSIGAHASLEIKNNLRSLRSRLIKRTLDIVLVIIGGVLISPLLLLIVLAIRLDSPGPAVYRARRIGRDGREFFCLKFRSMHRDADAKLRSLLESRPDLRAEFEATHKLKDDPRVTRVGAFLRKTSLDELPQLWNVLVGEMSLVGPRPIVQAEVPKYGNVYRIYKQVRPGMTGYWQANGRSDTSYQERVEMDAFYVTNWTPWLDLILLLQTVRVVLLGKGAY
ncbi:Undecaprenyl-phosphate galactose phosphotransferase WbaP [Deinobacterium chartae]|uniref:Undecaprenyl-phosphate galactose phosphotransferase WbaP n=1 Tax=Deinobacterium chartae TaxID=521158 RepID=A0A841I026_9DEIO|nr:undecaprenyl-phosphate galactose phosphotransferase WbaP [Deinobacterium chartae]MBB6097608.1 Undecaprenyl-phosphate galactose phosphotransferase WbaP [Deinobacterium chartae]